MRSNRSLRFDSSVAEVIRSLPPEQKRRIRRALDMLRQDPVLGKALKDELVGWRSLRVGRARIVYREREHTIEVAAIGPRASIYLDIVKQLRREAQGVSTSSTLAKAPRTRSKGLR